VKAIEEVEDQRNRNGSDDQTEDGVHRTSGVLQDYALQGAADILAIGNGELQQIVQLLLLHHHKGIRIPLIEAPEKRIALLICTPLELVQFLKLAVEGA